MPSPRRKITGDHEKGESPPTIGVVTDDLVENNRDVRPLVRYVTGEKIRKGRSIARRAILATVIHYTLDAIYVSSSYGASR